MSNFYYKNNLVTLPCILSLLNKPKVSEHINVCYWVIKLRFLSLNQTISAIGEIYTSHLLFKRWTPFKFRWGLKEKWGSFTLTGAVRRKSAAKTDEEELLWNLALSIRWFQCMAAALLLKMSDKEKKAKKKF